MKFEDLEIAVLKGGIFLPIHRLQKQYLALKKADVLDTIAESIKEEPFGPFSFTPLIVEDDGEEQVQIKATGELDIQFTLHSAGISFSAQRISWSEKEKFLPTIPVAYSNLKESLSAGVWTRMGLELVCLLPKSKTNALKVLEDKISPISRKEPRGLITPQAKFLDIDLKFLVKDGDYTSKLRVTTYEIDDTSRIVVIMDVQAEPSKNPQETDLGSVQKQIWGKIQSTLTEFAPPLCVD
ncbi:MAG: hypothetical protein ABIJ96_08410 [Elusimicrobiota bacterium]